MKTHWKKVMAGTLCAALVIGGAHLTAMAVPSQDSGAAEDSQNTDSTQATAQLGASAKMKPCTFSPAQTGPWKSGS